MSKYDALSAQLDRTGPPLKRMSFAEIEEALGFSLPVSARQHRPWWANDPSHVQARSWMDAGWETTDVDLQGERVTFRRAPLG